MLEPFAANLWTVARKLRFFGVETGTRMTLVKLSCGGLFVHSPIALNPALQEAVDALGPVKAIVAPSLFHHLYVGEWVEAYPDASVHCCPKLEKKRDDLAWTGVLTDTPEAAWSDDLDQVFFGARSLENEVVFFHRASRTLICSDFVFHLSSHKSLLTRIVAVLLWNRKPGATVLEHIMIRDKVAAKEQLGRIVGWDPEGIILAHGENIEVDGRGVIERSFAWLL